MRSEMNAMSAELSQLQKHTTSQHLGLVSQLKRALAPLITESIHSALTQHTLQRELQIDTHDSIQCEPITAEHKETEREDSECEAEDVQCVHREIDALRQSLDRTVYQRIEQQISRMEDISQQIQQHQTARDDAKEAV